jgi:hypothetical protein
MTLGTDHNIGVDLVQDPYGCHQSSWVYVSAGIDKADDLAGRLMKTEAHRIALSPVSLIAEYSDPRLGAFKRMVESVVRATIDHNDDFVARRDCFQDILHVLDVCSNASTLSVCRDDN